MGCKCEIPNFEKKDEITSDIKSNEGINLNQINHISENDSKLKSPLIKNPKNTDDDSTNRNNNYNNDNDNFNLDHPITLEKEKEKDDNYNIFQPTKNNGNNNDNDNNNNNNDNNFNNNYNNDNNQNNDNNNNNDIKNDNDNNNNNNNNNNNEINDINPNEIETQFKDNIEMNEENENNDNIIPEGDGYIEPDIEDPFKRNEKQDPKDDYPTDDFSKYIFEHINIIRKNPKVFIQTIEESKSKVTTDKNGRLIFKSSVKVALNKGIPVFEEAISVLEGTEPMDELKFCSDLCIPVPDNEIDIKDKNYLKQRVEDIKEKYNVLSFWRDIIKDAETSFILMIVDDTGNKSGVKRNDILNPNYKYIGISSVMIGKSFVCFVTFSDSNKKKND